MSIRLAVRPLVLLRNRLAVERKQPWLVKAQNSLRLALSAQRSPARSEATVWEYIYLLGYRKAPK